MMGGLSRNHRQKQSKTAELIPKLLGTILILFISVPVVYLPGIIPATHPDNVILATSSPRISISEHHHPNPVGPNINIAGETPPDRQQVETTVAIDPRNPDIIVAGAQDLQLKPLGHRWHGYYRSTDGGKTWSSSLLPGFPGDTSAAGLSSPLHASNTTSDPVVAFDRYGNVYYAGLVFNITAGPFGNVTLGNPVAFVARYTEDGRTYSGATLITDAVFADKDWVTVDNSGGPYDGTLYLAFDGSLTNTTYGTVFTRSVDGGRSFSPPFYAPADMTGEFPGITVDHAGYIYLSTVAFDPVTGVPLNYTQVTKIAPGGASIVRNVRVVDPAQWLFGPLPGGQFRTFTVPQMASDSKGVYMVFDDMGQGNANVFLTRSMDGGSTWTAPLRINDASQGQHFFPTIAATEGIITVAWYDSRLSNGGTMNKLDVYFSESLNEGASFLPNIRVTTRSFNPNTANRADSPNPNERFLGDYIQIAATHTTAHPVWADNLKVCDTVDPTYGCVDQDAFTSTINLSLISQDENHQNMNGQK